MRTLKQPNETQPQNFCQNNWEWSSCFPPELLNYMNISLELPMATSSWGEPGPENKANTEENKTEKWWETDYWWQPFTIWIKPYLKVGLSLDVSFQWANKCRLLLKFVLIEFLSLAVRNVQTGTATLVLRVICREKKKGHLQCNEQIQRQWGMTCWY